MIICTMIMCIIIYTFTALHYKLCHYALSHLIMIKLSPEIAHGLSQNQRMYIITIMIIIILKLHPLM